MLLRSGRRLKIGGSHLNLSNLPSDQDSQRDSPADWSNLPEDILEHIFKCVNDPLDLLRCHGVCHSWYSVGRHFLRQYFQGLPPLIIFTENRRTNDGSSSSTTSEKEMVFYNYHSRKFCRFHIPLDLHGSRLSSGSHGWVIFTQRDEPYKISLLNAVSRAEITLPITDVIRDTHKLRLIMSGNPSIDINCTFLVISRREKIIMLYKLGDRSWRRVSTNNMSSYDHIVTGSNLGEQPPINCQGKALAKGFSSLPPLVESAHFYGAATFYEGNFYVYVGRGIMLMIDVTTSQVTQLNTEIEGSPQERQDFCNIEAGKGNIARDNYMMVSTGDLLHIVKCMRSADTDQTEVKVYKLDKERKVWLEVEDLGNRALFVGYNYSFTVLVPTTRDGEENGGGIEGTWFCRANCIYFIDDSNYFVENQVGSGGPAGAHRGTYDMNTREFKGWVRGLGPIWFNSPLSWIKPEV